MLNVFDLDFSSLLVLQEESGAEARTRKEPLKRNKFATARDRANLAHEE